MPRGLLTLLTLAATAATARAGVVGSSLDPQLATPYDWRVVVRFAPGPLFTPGYRTQLLRDTRAALQPTLGELGTVTVTDLDAIPDAGRSPLVTAFAAGGWPALDDPKFRELTGVKTHFLWLSADRGTVTLEARQHDGDTGLALPVVRVRATRDLQTASRLAGMMLARDFGPTATVEIPDEERDTVTVRFRGGALPGFDRLVKPGDILIVSEVYGQRRPEPPRVTSRSPRPRVADDLPPLRVAKPREYTLLRVEYAPDLGVARCRVLTRFKQAFTIARTLLGVRAMRVATTEAAVEVRVLDQNGRPPDAGTLLQARASDIGFLPTPQPRDRLELRDGLFRSQRPLRDVACVVVTVGASLKPEFFPVPILDESPIRLRFAVNPKDVAQAEFDGKLNDLRRGVVAAQETQRTLVEELARLIVAGKNPQALERAVTGLEALAALDKSLAAEVAAVKADPSAAGAAAELAAVDARLAGLREGRPAIAARADELRKLAGKVADPANFEREFAAKERALRIRRLIAAGEIDEALAEYDLLYDLTKQEQTKEQKSRLAAEWKPRNDEHAKARDFVASWRKLDGPAAYETNIDALAAAAATLKSNRDRLGLRYLLTTLDQTGTKLVDFAGRLDRSEADLAVVDKLKSLSAALTKIETDARDAVAEIEK
jgi:hypothetical protein